MGHHSVNFANGLGPTQQHLLFERLLTGGPMAFPIKICSICSEEFELKPGKPGFANRCPSCSEPESDTNSANAMQRGSNKELDQERRKAMRDLLYRKDS
jgi:hypothetical protein